MDETGAIRARTRSGPANPILMGMDASVAALVDAAEAALSAANVSAADVRFINGAVAGAGATRNLAQLIGRLEQKFPNAKALIDSDAAFALGATGETPSVVVIAGTGSVVCGATIEETVREGGLGVILGDPGSAYDIGRKAFVAEWRRYLDGEDSVLGNSISHEFACDWSGLREQVFNDSRRILPRIFPLVARAANANHQQAQELLRSSAEELAVLVERVVKRLRLAGERFLLAKTGGVFNRSGYFDEPFDRRVRAIAPKVRIGALPTPVAEYAAQVGIAVLRRPEKLAREGH
jgi:N-acetylmuramic acid 6-phosphate etherase